MADLEQLHRLTQQGPSAWNKWRKQTKGLRIDLRQANLSRVDLRDADLRDADLYNANLRLADLRDADFRMADLRMADLRAANLRGATFAAADLTGANFTEANLLGASFVGAALREAILAATNLTKAVLSRANLRGAILSEADLREVDLSLANLEEAVLNKTVLVDVDLSNSQNLDSVRHSGPSMIDIRTLQRSGPLPLAFLRGVGLPDNLIDYLPSLLSQVIQHYSCFISYSSKDDEFAHRLHADLQDKGVRCWFAPHDMKIGAKILDTLDEAIRLRDKVLLVLSEGAIASDWVEDEVTKAFEEERQRGGVVLFPVRVDDAVFDTKEAWAAKLRANRNICDFRAWRDHDAYQKALERVLRDLRVESSEPA
jgi:uncharacterized protein YjbI with pentapeptide repeats